MQRRCDSLSLMPVIPCPEEPPPYKTAAAFLAALSPSHETWRDRFWIFRGQGSAKWDLVPSALRGKPPPTWCREDHWPADLPARLRVERELVLEFWGLADRVGLAVPEDSAWLRSPRGLRAVFGAPTDPAKGWPPADFLGIAVLAQHYGVPTRLLDWTWKPRIAAYFAARDVMVHGDLGDKSLAVWALWTKAISTLWEPATNEDPDVEIVHAPLAPNPNLAAQAGILTVVRGAQEKEGLERVLAAKIPTRPDIAWPHAPLIKLTLPVSEARALMALLSYEMIHAATVFPGYGSVVDALDEMKWGAGAR